MKREELNILKAVEAWMGNHYEPYVTGNAGDAFDDCEHDLANAWKAFEAQCSGKKE